MVAQATSREATPAEVNIFVADVDEFMTKYAKLISPEFRAKVYATGNTENIANYESKVSQGRAIKNTIETTTGAWLGFKREWSKVTDVTSTVIGDAVDWLRGIFGDDPYGGAFDAYDISPISGGQLGRYDISPISGGQLGALGAIPLITYAFIAGLAVVLVTYIKGLDKFFVWIDAWSIQRDDPSISRAEALDKAAQVAARDNLFAGAALPLLAAAAIAAFLIFGKKK